ncbi:hypothetical protein [Chitinophaga sp.]|uniref:hypothetical protein n=1 Tax=Chitinophaga sp. TaxID=1869181 RepID=UPI0031D5B5F4
MCLLATTWRSKLFSKNLIKGPDPANTDLTFIEPLSQKKYSLDPDAFDIIQKPPFTISSLPQTVQLVMTSLRSLGLPDGTCYRDIFTAAQNAGLHLCPPEIGLQLQLHYMDQPFEETLVIGMQPLEDNDGLPSVFTVHHWDWAVALGAACCGMSNVEDEWHADSNWVFMIG